MPYTFNNRRWRRQGCVAVVSTAKDYTVLLAYVGCALDYLVSTLGDGTYYLGLSDPPADGYWVWEGDYAWFDQNRPSVDKSKRNYVAVGAWRELTAEEYQRHLHGQPIWDLEDWYTKEALAEMRAEEEKGNP